MGHIDRFNIKEIKEKHRLNVFIETGTGLGVSLEYAMRFNFERFYSIEINDKLYGDLLKKFKQDNCNIIHGKSIDGLDSVLTNMIDENDKILYWLDAHFPGADFHLSGYGSEKDYHTRIPLESELRKICEIRDVSNDYFLIDDLRIYEDGAFTGGNWNQRKQLGGDGIDFIYELFDKTHKIERDYREQGYIVLIPKNE